MKIKLGKVSFNTNLIFIRNRRDFENDLIKKSTLNALHTYFNVTCAMQIMLGTLPDTYINA